MIDIRIPKEIRKYKEKLFFGLTARQFVCTVIAGVINIPLYFYSRQYLGDDLASWLVIAIAIPIMLAGYFSYNEMPFEEFLITVIKFEFIYPQKRKYVTENLYELLDKEEKTSGVKEEEKGKKDKRERKGLLNKDARNTKKQKK